MGSLTASWQYVWLFCAEPGLGQRALMLFVPMVGNARMPSLRQRTLRHPPLSAAVLMQHTGIRIHAAYAQLN
jgi:hypothetical protein